MVSTQPLSWFRQEPTLAAGGEVRQNPCIPALPSPGPQFACLDNGQGLYTQQGLPLAGQAVVGGWAAHTGRISAVPKFIRRGFSLPPQAYSSPRTLGKAPFVFRSQSCTPAGLEGESELRSLADSVSNPGHRLSVTLGASHPLSAPQLRIPP